MPTQVTAARTTGEGMTQICWLPQINTVYVREDDPPYYEQRGFYLEFCWLIWWVTFSWHWIPKPR